MAAQDLLRVLEKSPERVVEVRDKSPPYNPLRFPTPAHPGRKSETIIFEIAIKAENVKSAGRPAMPREPGRVILFSPPVLSRSTIRHASVITSAVGKTIAFPATNAQQATSAGTRNFPFSSCSLSMFIGSASLVREGVFVSISFTFC